MTKETRQQRISRGLDEKMKIYKNERKREKTEHDS